MDGGVLAVGPDRVLAAEHLSVWQHQAGSYQLGSEDSQALSKLISVRYEVPACFIVHVLGDKHGVGAGDGQGKGQ